MGMNGKEAIYLIINLDEFSKEDVVRLIKEEGFTHNFFFGNLTDVEDKSGYIRVADEVWIFGDCEDISDYQEAVRQGKDIWVMG